MHDAQPHQPSACPTPPSHEPKYALQNPKQIAALAPPWHILHCQPCWVMESLSALTDRCKARQVTGHLYRAHLCSCPCLPAAGLRSAEVQVLP